jgi:hypothetical protein
MPDNGAVYVIGWHIDGERILNENNKNLRQYDTRTC